MNILVDNNIVLDYYNTKRREEFKESIEALELIFSSDRYEAYISVSSLDNLEFVKATELKRAFGYANKKILNNIIKDILSLFKIAKTPSYIEMDYEDIEDSQIIASAKAIGAKVLTRDKGMLKKYFNIAITPKDFLENIDNNKNIDFANLKKQYFLYQPELGREMDRVLNNSSYIMGSAVERLERNLEEFTGAKHAITCSSGTDALLLAMMALDIGRGDEVITTPFTFIATAETIAFLGAKPVFVDIDEKTYNIDPSKIEDKISSKTKAIMPVSLYGQPSNMDEIQAIATKHNLKVIIDGAQSFGSTFNGVSDSNLGDISTTSFFPAKPLGCFGDGGAVFTNDETLVSKIKSLRVHGQSKRYHHKHIGMGGRMDALQCAIVDVKLKYYSKDLTLRQEVALKYSQKLKDKELILPFIDSKATSAFAQYSIRVKNRDSLQVKLKELGIPTAVHYPMPLHLQECFEYLDYKDGDFPISEKISKEILSLPMNPYVSSNEIDYISTNI